MFGFSGTEWALTFWFAVLGFLNGLIARALVRLLRGRAERALLPLGWGFILVLMGLSLLSLTDGNRALPGALGQAGVDEGGALWLRQYALGALVFFTVGVLARALWRRERGPALAATLGFFGVEALMISLGLLVVHPNLLSSSLARAPELFWHASLAAIWLDGVPRMQEQRKPTG